MGTPTRTGLRLFPALTLAAFLLPILTGLLFTWLPAFGYLPAAGAHRVSLEPFTALLGHPSLPGALRTTLVSGVGATLLSCGMALFIAATLYGSRWWRLVEVAIAPLLALPHAAFAIGFSFLVAPSGWLVRLVSPGLTGFDFPPSWTTVGDPWGVSLTLTMVLKETPFLLLMIFSGLSRLDVRRTIWVGRSLGYHRLRIWSRLIIPQLYPMLRLPVMAVLAYSLSVVDLAYIIGPSAPPTLSVMIDRLFNDPDFANRLTGAAGATLLLALTLVLIGAFRAAEAVIDRLAAARRLDGVRKPRLAWLLHAGPALAMLLLALHLLGLLALVAWSCTGSWRFPEALPASLSLAAWHRSFALMLEPLRVSGVAAAVSSLIAIILVIGCFENERRLSRAKKVSVGQRSLLIMYLPLLIPQIAFLFGIQVILIRLHLDGRWPSLVWSHLVFVLPYVFLTLANHYRSYDERYSQVAVTLCSRPLRSFMTVKLPILAKPILFCLAVGFSVSIAQYLPTLYVGAGRFATITTETVNLASGSDRRIIGVYALAQFLLPLVVYTIAILLPAILFRNRKAMQN